MTLHLDKGRLVDEVIPEGPVAMVKAKDSRDLSDL